MTHATIRDVAREAAVSVASVSRVLNGHGNVRPALRERVQTVAARLGYVPHVGARNLSLARSNALGVMLPDLYGEFYSEALRGMDREASSRGLQLLLSNMHADAGRAAEALRTMRGRVDGMVIMAPDIAAEQLVAHLPASMPAVLINCPPGPGRRPELRVDNAAAAGAMVDHLVATGRRRIVHLAGPAFNLEASERVRGYHAAMRAAGLEARVMEGDFTEESGAAAVAALLGEAAMPDALFAANDMMAIGAIVALREAGVAVPDRIAVAGFDDVPLARLISPALTTMRVDVAAIGARAIARLAEVIGGQEDHEVELRTPVLVVRETTARGGAEGITRQEKQGERP